MYMLVPPPFLIGYIVHDDIFECLKYVLTCVAQVSLIPNKAKVTFKFSR